MKKLFAILFAVFFSLYFTNLWADAAQDHEALRSLRKQATEALNTNNFDALAPLLDQDFTVITVDNHKFTNLQDFKTYWNNLFHGKDALLKRIEVDPQADALTQFVCPDAGVVFGTSNDTYYFTDGDNRKMPSRWTAVVKRTLGGWKIVSVHFSANIMDNPVLAATKRMACWYAIGGLIIGFIIGVILMLLIRRKP